MVDRGKNLFGFGIRLVVLRSARLIRRIRLVNFMSHDDTVLELADGLTVLVGPNNCGKSAIVGALQILCHNTASNHVIRHNERECSVTVETSDGHTVEWRRTKTSAKYIVDGTTFDRLGRGAVPEQVHQALRLPKVKTKGGQDFDIHFGEQKSPVFLLDKPPSHAAQFFAASNDASSLIEMQSRHKSRVADSRRRKLELQSDAQRLSDELAVLNATDEIALRVERAEAAHADLHTMEARQQGLVDRIDQLQLARQRLDEHHAREATLATLSAPLVLEDTAPLSALIAGLRAAQHVASHLTEECAAVRTLSAQPTLSDTASLDRVSRELATVLRAEAFAAAQAASLRTLATPPAVYATEALEHHIERLAQATIAHRRCESVELQLVILTAPPECRDTREIEALIRLVDEAHVCARNASALAARAAVELESGEREMREWILAHPMCATCGANLDADRLVADGDSCARDHPDA